MSRYVERAENIARFVDVNLQLMLDVPRRQAELLARNWLPVVYCLGDEESFAKRRRKSDDAAVTEFLVFDREHPNSIVSCLCSARENARTVREQITTDMWEQLNRTYLWCNSKSARQTFERSQYDYFQRLRESLQLFQAATDTTMLHGEGWEFIQIGKYLERADKTSRVLDEEYHLLRQVGDAPNAQLVQYLGVLRSCSARQIYRRIYSSGVQPIRVAELLLLNEHFPRSVRFCAIHVDRSLRQLSGVRPGHFSNAAEKISGRLLAELSFSTIEDLFAVGLHRAMDDLQVKFNQIGGAIYQTYLHQELPPEPVAVVEEQPVQQ